MNRPTKPTDYSQLMVEILLWFVFAVVGSFVWMVNVRSKVPASWSIFHRCARVICLYHSMPTVSTITNTTVRVHTLCLKKNRTPITFWNNSNKLCLIIIMISWENRQKVLNIVVCYGLTIFHKTEYQLRLFPWRLVEVWSGLRQTVVDDAVDEWRRRLRACVQVKGQHNEHLL